MIYRIWTVMRLENLMRVRLYKESVTRRGDEEMTDKVILSAEHIVAARDLGEFMIANKIDKFGDEDDMEMHSRIFA